MRFVFVITTMCLLLTASQFAQAESFWQKLSLKAPCSPSQIGRCCPDDFQRKCEPLARPVCKFQCDDYCPKFAPCPKRVECFECEPYCKKCPPFQMKPNCAGLRCPLPLPCTAKLHDVRGSARRR
jgi:hypothetical protein